MAAARISVRKLKEVIRLDGECGLSQRQIAESCQVAPSTVSDYLRRARLTGLSWPQVAAMDERTIMARLFSAQADRP